VAWATAPATRTGCAVSRTEEIIDVAERLLEAEGPDALSMRRVADKMGIRGPSLYKHVANKDVIEAALQQRSSAWAPRSRGRAATCRRWQLPTANGHWSTLGGTS